MSANATSRCSASAQTPGKQWHQTGLPGNTQCKTVLHSSKRTTHRGPGRNGARGRSSHQRSGLLLASSVLSAAGTATPGSAFPATEDAVPNTERLSEHISMVPRDRRMPTTTICVVDAGCVCCRSSHAVGRALCVWQELAGSGGQCLNSK